MEKRVSKIIVIALTLSLCASVVQMNSMGMYRWATSKFAAARRRVSGVFRSASNAWSDLDRNTGGIASWAFNAATKKAFSFMIKAALDKYEQGLLENSTEVEKEKIIEHIQKVAFFVPAIIIPEIWQVFRARGWRIRGALLSRSVYKLILSEAFYRAGVKLHKQGEISSSLYSFFIDQSSDYLSQATTDQLLLPAIKQPIESGEVQEELAPSPGAVGASFTDTPIKKVEVRKKLVPSPGAVRNVPPVPSIKKVVADRKKRSASGKRSISVVQKRRSKQAKRAKKNKKRRRLYKA